MARERAWIFGLLSGPYGVVSNGIIADQPLLPVESADQLLRTPTHVGPGRRGVRRRADVLELPPAATLFTRHIAAVINSLGNIPVIYMRQVDGWGGDHWGARGLAGAEAVVGGIGGLALLVFFLVRKPAATHIPTASISSGAAEPLD